MQFGTRIEMKTQDQLFQSFSNLKTLNITDKKSLIKRYEELLSMDLTTTKQAIEFQRQRDEITKHGINEWAESYFLTTTDVADEKKRERQEYYEQQILPLTQEWDQKLTKKFLDAESCKKLKAPFSILRRNLNSEFELFREKNIVLHKESTRLRNEITELQGKLTATYRGKEMPLSQFYPLMESTDRAVRKDAYEGRGAAEESVCDVIDKKFDQLLKIRSQIAKNADCDSYTKYRFKELQRFDWDEKDCFQFHDSVKKHIVPLREKLDEQRLSSLNLDSIRPYDTAVDIFGREPLKIYEKGDTKTLIEGAGKIVKAIDDELYQFFLQIKKNNLFDLDARNNKAPGGYMLMYPVYEQASVFYNCAGMSLDLMVLLHELGHCFHYFLGKNVEPYPLQNWSPEVAEGGSMSMEFIGLENLEEFVESDQAKRMKEDRLRSIIGLFTYCAQGDEFQHWIYANPGHNKQERRDKWTELSVTYSPGIDRSGYEQRMSKIGWQYLHILQIPYYLIDYSISELLALSVWDRYKKDPKDGIEKYKQGCSLAASKSVPDLYNAFGTKLSFGEEVIEPLASRLMTELSLG